MYKAFKTVIQRPCTKQKSDHKYENTFNNYIFSTYVNIDIHRCTKYIDILCILLLLSNYFYDFIK